MDKQYDYLAPDYNTFKAIRHVILDAHDGLEGSANANYTAYNYEHYNGGQEWDDDELTLIQELFARTLQRRFAIWESGYGYDGVPPEGTSEAYWEHYVRDVAGAIQDFEEEWFTVGGFNKVSQAFLDDLYPWFRKFCDDLQAKQAKQRRWASLTKIEHDGQVFHIVGKPFLSYNEGDEGFSDEDCEDMDIPKGSYDVHTTVIVKVEGEDGYASYAHYGHESVIFDSDGNRISDEPIVEEMLHGEDYPNTPNYVGLL